MRRLNVLINAYAVSPAKGSEPGMGWNWIINISKTCNIIVITESEFKDKIEFSLKSNDFGKNIKVHYIGVSEKVRKMCWNQGDWRFYFYYRIWQKKAYKKALEIIHDEKIDLIHQLNMIGYREPGLMWKIDHIPVVWGPVGGFGKIPMAFVKTFKTKDAIHQLFKNLINKYQVYLPYISKAINNFNAIIACNSDAQKALSLFRNDNVNIINEAGTFIEQDLNSEKWDNPQLKIIWIGRNIPSKSLDIAIEVMQLLKDFNIQLQIVGVNGESKEFPNIIYKPWIPHQEVQQILSESHLLLFTSLYEATGTVVLESISKGIPVLCHNTCGQGDVIDNTCGVKIELLDRNYSVISFKNEIINLFHDRAKLESLSKGALQKAKVLTWELNTEKLIKVYKNLIQ